MADVHPIVRIDQASGYVYLRESVIVAFFLDPPIASSSSELLSAFDLFLSMVPDGALRWESIGASSEEWKPIDKSTLKRCRAQLSPQAAAKRRLTSFELADGERAGDVPNYGFLVLGGPRRPELPGEKCLLQMSLPTSVIEGDRAEAFVQRVAQIASVVPYTSGYASPALQWAERDRERAFAEARALAVRYPGYDVQMNTTGRKRLGSRVRGARWITFLGENLAAEVGGAKALRMALPEQVQIEAVGVGVMVRAGLRPELGDKANRRDTPLLASVAKVLEPVTAFGEVVLLGSFAEWDKAVLEKWERRFLD